MIFQGNPDINKTAYMNWRTDKHDQVANFITLADGYAEGSLLLIGECLEDNTDKKADSVIFPILFSVNQAIELYLKAIEWSLNILGGRDAKFTGGHDIRQIWQTVKGKVNGYEKNERRDQFKALTDKLDDYINELYSKIDPAGKAKGIKNMDFSRYPLNSDKQPHFYILMADNCMVDLKELKGFWSEM